MDLLSEYQQQQTRRNWPQYLQSIPLQASDTVLDLGCSVGNVSHLFADQVKQVVGVDLNPDFIEFCNQQKTDNQQFLCADFLDLDFTRLPRFSGVWASFSLSYLPDAQAFLNQLYSHLSKGSWIAILDVSCFVSGNMDRHCRFYQPVRQFELASSASTGYDFNFAASTAARLRNAGFKLLTHKEDVYDAELNFDGAATPEVHSVWQARLSRLVKLKQVLGEDFADFKQAFLTHLSANTHQKGNNLQFFVAVK